MHECAGVIRVLDRRAAVAEWDESRSGRVQVPVNSKQLPWHCLCNEPFGMCP
jgi:hypothetical protein